MTGKIMVQGTRKAAAGALDIQGKPSVGVWSAGVIVPVGARLCFPGGFTSRDAAGKVVAPHNAAGQTRQICENIKNYCEDLGCDLADVVNLTVFITDMDDWEDIHRVRREYWPVDPPSSALLQVVRCVDERHKLEMIPVIMIPEGVAVPGEVPARQ
jgi:enamine deaminase RidA (YjgF/YER057c/UK114 family)